MNFKLWIMENSGIPLIDGKAYTAKDIQNYAAEGDLQSVAEWMNVPLESLVFQYRLVPINIFAKQAEDMFGTYDEFPQDKKRTDKIGRIIKHQPAYPVFVEMGDPTNFIMEGRHRIVAFWQAGMQQIPVFYVGIVQ